jgi:hypothetical protein
MQNFLKQFYPSLICFFLLFLAALVTDNAQAASFPLPPRFSAEGYASDYTVGQADLMLPMKGNSAQNLYLDPNLSYASNNQGYADLGLGYRWIRNEAAILGAYLFGGYSRIENNARLWVANPGIEALGSRWDAHLNGYLAMGDRNLSQGNFLGSQLGLHTIHFEGHTEYDQVFQIAQHAGPGADVKLGYQLFPRSSLKGYLGSYFFSPSHTSNIWGGAAGLEYWLDSYIKVFGAYTYDNVRHSTGAFGLGVEFGGTHVHRSDPALEERITDPVERYLAALGRGSPIPSRKNRERLMGIGTSSGIPGIPDLEDSDDGPVVPILEDIAFFSQAGLPNNGGVGLTITNCTFANPCGPNDFSQTGINTLNGLLPDTVMFFNGGSYPAVGLSPLALNAGQSVHGRNADYTEPAVSSVFNGAFILANNTTLDSIILLPVRGTNEVGVDATGATTFLVTNSQIGSPSSSFLRAALAIGSLGSAAGSGSIVNSVLYGAEAVYLAAPNSELTIQDSTLNGTGSNLVTPAAVLSAINATNNALIIQNSTLNASVGSGVYGISMVGNNSQLTIEDSTVNVSNSGGTGYGLNLRGANSKATIENSTWNVASSGSASTAYGLYSAATGPGFALTVDGGAINLTGGAEQTFSGITNIVSTVSGAPLTRVDATGIHINVQGSSSTKSYALLTNSNSTTLPAINVTGSALSVTGNINSSIISGSSAAFQISGSTCSFNGHPPQPCVIP